MYVTHSLYRLLVGLTLTTCLVVPDISHPERIYTFESGAVGSHVTQEQIWAFKLRVLAADIDLMFGLIANMQATVPPGKTQWAAGVKQFVTAIVNLQNVSGTLCDETASPTTSQPPKT